MSERVLVTGGAGFIGSHVAERYLAEGFEVTVLDDLSHGKREHVPAGAAFVQADVASPEARALLAEGAFTVLNHHAAQADVRVSVRDPVFDAQVNLLGLLNVLEGARAGGVRRVVFASSGGVVYGEGTPPFAEEAAKLPVSPYGVSKLGSEYYLAAYAQLYDLETVALRYANVYGPRQDPHGEAGVVAIFCDRLRAGQPVTVYGDGEQTRDYVHVSDVARANLAATTCAVPPLGAIDDVAFNVGTGVETSVNALVAGLREATGRPVPVDRAPARAGELARSAVRIAKAARLWGWGPTCSLTAGLKQTYHWVAEEAA